LSDSTAKPFTLSALPGGIRVVTEEMPSVRSVALGFWIRTGSRDESPAQAGVSHFLEHLLFKGTKRFSAVEIAEYFDGLGASVNAATGKEMTQLHARFLDTHLEAAFDLLAEMLLQPTYPEVDSERQVVLEEIAMYEDEPMDRVHDVLADAVWGEHPLGRRVLGSADVIASIPVPKIDAYHRARYVAPRIVVAAAGNMRHDQIEDLAKRHLGPAAGDGADRGGADVPDRPRVSFHAKDTEQYHVCFGGPGIARDDERRWALGVVDAAFGGSTSSRLFQEVREKRGLAYAVGSYSEQYRDGGIVAMYVGTRADNVERACEVIGTELGRLQEDGLTDEELERAREHVKGRLVLSLEAPSARASRIGKAVLFDLPLLTVDEMLAKVDAVTPADVTEVAREFYAPESLSAAAVGADEDKFRRAIEPVSGALAAA
jgi:predicted Zn-dependent peptidase